jgi:signal transduction histidine kinase
MNGTIRFAAIAAFFLGMAVLTLGMCMSFASRLKQHMLWNRLLTVRFARLLWRGLQKSGKAAGDAAFQLPLIWRSVLAIAVITVLEFFAIIAFHWDGEWLLLIWLLEKIVLVPFVLSVVLTMRRLQQAGRAMAAGDLQYQIDTKAMLPDFKEHAENLGSISNAMTIAVDQRLKSERMKTELITNVSHDIKTPLTSIINYADLIAREKPENEKIAEYCEVLTRQSGKLKRLIEDLVEASKASTGNLEVNPVPCDASIFLQQAGGEYEEKLEAAGLSLVTKLPDREIMILADSRRMWRVFDNLMNNVCKYSQQGTRVYLSLEAEGQEAVITFKNTSARQLDISPEELMERFVRGDSSRNTEGNGLGLSIARSLTELQGGIFSLQVDGDLFKAILRFPIFFMNS